MNCSVPPTQVLTPINSTSFQLRAVDSDGCSGSNTFDPTDAEEQYGVFATDAESCGYSQSTSVEVLPVLFWFFMFNAPNQQDPIAKMVLCRPEITVYNVSATVDFNNGSLTSVQPLNNYTAPNNISAFLKDGKALNG